MITILRKKNIERRFLEDDKTGVLSVGPFSFAAR